MTDWESKDIQPIGKQYQLKNPLKMRGMLGDALKIYIFILFIYFWLCWVFVAVWAFLQLQQAVTTL